jgi:hypothetical protein
VSEPLGTVVFDGGALILAITNIGLADSKLQIEATTTDPEPGEYSSYRVHGRDGTHIFSAHSDMTITEPSEGEHVTLTTLLSLSIAQVAFGVDGVWDRADMSP